MLRLLLLALLSLIHLSYFNSFSLLFHRISRKEIKVNVHTDKSPFNDVDSYKSLLLKTVLTSTSLFIPYLTSSVSFANDLTIENINIDYDGVSKPVKEYLGKKATLIVNVASQCALTPQYDELVDLYEKYNSKGFQILAFPSNQFGSQEPDEVTKIRKDMLKQFNVKFPIFDKIDVNGPFAHPLYQSLKSVSNIGTSNISKISWNFEKFLIDKNGIPVRRYKPGIRPLSIEDDIKSLVETGVLPQRKKITLNDYSS